MASEEATGSISGWCCARMGWQFFGGYATARPRAVPVIYSPTYLYMARYKWQIWEKGGFTCSWNTAGEAWQKMD